MNAVDTNKSIVVLNKYKKPIIAVVTMTLFCNVFAGDLQHVSAAIPNEPVKTSITAENEFETLSEQIKRLVKGLEYPSTVAEDFVELVLDWKDEQGRPVLAIWNEQVKKGREDYKQNRISKDQLTQNEELVINELIKRIKKDINYSLGADDLGDVLEKGQASCLGYTQIFYVLGNTLRLSVSAIKVDLTRDTYNVEKTNQSMKMGLVTKEIPSMKVGHVANMVSLANGKSVIVDLTSSIELKEPFNFAEQYRKVASYWELKHGNLSIYKRIQVLDREGLLCSIYNNRGCVFREQGQTKNAISEFTKAINVSPGISDLAYDNRARIYYNTKQYTEAINDYTKVIEINPKCSWAYIYRGFSYKELSLHAKAIDDFTKAMELDSCWTSTSYVYRGFEYSQMGKYSQALCDYNKGIDRSPKSAEPYLMRASAYASLGKLQKAMRDLLITVALDRSLWASANELCRKFNVNLSFEDSPNLKSDKTLLYFKRALELNPNDSHIYLNRGNAYLNLGQLHQAVSDFTKAIELNPMDEYVYNDRGITYAMLGKTDQAMADFTKAIEVSPKDPTGYLNRGKLHKIEGQYKEAILDYTKAGELEGAFGVSSDTYQRRGAAWLSLAIDLLRKGLNVDPSICEHAFSDLSKAIQLDPADASACFDCAYICAISGRDGQAREYALRAVELDSSMQRKVKWLSDYFKLNLKLD